MTYSSVPVAITETLSKKFLCSRSCFRKPSFQTLMPPLFIPKRNKSSKKIYLYPNSRSTLRFNSNKRTRMNASEMPICSLRSWRDSRVSAFVLVAKPRTREAKPWEDWWRVELNFTRFSLHWWRVELNFTRFHFISEEPARPLTHPASYAG